MTKKKTDMPTSAKQVNTNRANGRRSTGPSTDAGKERSSSNSITHGLYSTRTTAIPRGTLAEDAEAVHAFIEECMAELNPGTPLEELVARQVAIAMLRTLRLEAYEAVLLGQAGREPDASRGSAREAELHRQIASLKAVLQRIVTNGKVAASEADVVVLVERLPQAEQAAVMQAMATGDATSDDVADIIDVVWMGDHGAAAAWITSAITRIEADLQEIDGSAQELAVARAAEMHFDRLSRLSQRVDTGLDRALARYRQLQARDTDDEKEGA